MHPVPPAAPRSTHGTRPCPYLAFPHRIHLLRSVGMALVFVMMATVLHTLDAPWPLWAGPVLHCFAWPHLAAWLSRRSPRVNRAEKRNLLLDHLFAGLWVPLLDFNLLACAVVLALLGMVGAAVGNPRSIAKGLAMYVLGIAGGALLFGVAWQPAPSMLTVLGCLPVLLLVPVGLGFTTYRTVEDLRNKHNELERLSWYDGLSGLFNRSHWEAAVRSEFNRCRRTNQPATLVLIDLDHFKQVNDLYGHATGDQAIRNFAQLLRDNLREFDVPGRYGGEEFGVLLPHTGPKEALELVNRLREKLHATPLLEHFTVTASFGISGLTADIENHGNWIRLTDQMLYNAKYNGRDRVIVLGREHGAGAATGPELLRPTMSPRKPVILSQLLQGIDASEAPIAMFDPSDRLVMANAAYLKVHHLPPGIDHFEAIIHSLHARRVGPVIEAETAGEWIARIARVRRQRPRHVFTLRTHEGQEFRGVETCFNGGWIIQMLVAPDLTLANASDGA